MLRSSSNFKREKPVFKTFNPTIFFKTILLRAFFILIIASAIINFNENRIVTSLVILFFSIVFINLGPSSIIVYKDRFQYKLGSSFNLLNSVDTYYYKDIKSISIDGFFTFTFDMLEDAIPNDVIDINPWNSIDLEFKDGKTKSIGTDIYMDELRLSLKFILQNYRQFNNINKD
jgi:hypothetical protein